LAAGFCSCPRFSAAAALTPFWWLIKSIMHLGLQVACGTNGGRAPQTLLHHHIHMHHHRSRCSHLNIKARHAQVLATPTAWAGFLAASAAFFNNKSGARLWK